MRKRCLLALIAFCTCAVLPARALAQQERPFQLALFTPVQIRAAEDGITILRLSLIYGKNAYVKGLDLGLVNHTTSGTTKGWQMGVVGYNEGAFVGWQDNYVNVTEGQMLGLQSGIFNSAAGGEGVQLGTVNVSDARFSGLQFSLVNIAEDLYGIQLGLVNIIKSKASLSFLPIVNWKF
jgi:hypothetical protein